MTVTRSAELKKSKQIATRSTTNGNTHFGQLPYHKKHKNKRQPKTIPKPIPIAIPKPILLPKECDDDDEAADDGENSIVSEYSIIPVRERLYFSEEEDEEEEEEEDIIIEGYGPDKYSVSVDFDEAQSEWEANKKRLVNGNYVYLCGKVTNGGKNKCRRGCSDGIGLYSGCAIHFMWEEIQHRQY